MKARIATVFLMLLSVEFLAPLQSVRAGERLVVHEWGTFTSLQDERGRELTGINVDDEPVPPFVHNLSPYILSSPVLSNQHWRYRQKAAPRRHPRVTMRLETPVIYFYPPKDQPLPMTLDVNVQFRGGDLAVLLLVATLLGRLVANNQLTADGRRALAGRPFRRRRVGPFVRRRG
ncbi:MAG: hypothetical protein IH999_11835 [Proteobacteria bacterium]|nr:hypothetical protein [Pseudomonadota bacterium]